MLAVGTAAASTTVLADSAVNASVSPSHEGFEELFADNNGQMRAAVPFVTPFLDSGAFLAPGTSPVVADLGNSRGVEVAFVGGDNKLWRASPEDNFFRAGFEVGRTLDVAPGTTPAVASDGNNHWKIAFQGSNGHMWTIDSSQQIVDSGAAMAPGSGPSIAWLPDAHGYEIAFAGSDHNLWRAFPDTNAFLTGPGFSAVGVAPDTSPAIATDGHNGWKIAFQGANGRLQTVSGSSLVDSGAAMAPGSSPSLTWLPGPAQGYEIAFVGSDHNLRRAFPDTNTFLAGPGFSAVGVAPDTSPSIVQFGPPGFATNSWQIAFQGSNGDMWLIDDRSVLVDTNARMAADTTPSETFRTFDTSTTPTTPPPTSSGPPQPHTATLTMNRQSVGQGPIPYAGSFPALGSVPPFHLISIRYPASGFLDTAVRFIRPGHSTAECDNPAAVVQLNEGATTTADQITAVYGSSAPHFDTLHPLTAVACFVGPSPTPGFINLEITVQDD